MADKSRRFELRLSEAEYARIQENMQELGTRNMSAYLRKMALDGYCIQLDTTVCPVMDYFEIFLDRMMLCRKSAEVLKTTFKLTVNGRKVL